MDFSLIGYDPEVSHLLAGIAMYIAEEGKCLWVWGGGLKINFVDFTVKKKFFLSCLILSWKGLCEI